MQISRLTKAHARRSRELYRSAGWPYQDVLEIELLAAGLLEHMMDARGVYYMRVTDAGIRYLAEAALGNRSALSAHNSLVARVGQSLLRDGRLVWTGLALRAAQSPDPQDAAAKTRWRICIPDVFSIRNTTVPGYLEPIVHEIKVARADLLGDLKKPDKRQAYLELGGQCWYVLAKATPLREPAADDASLGLAGNQPTLPLQEAGPADAPP